MVPSGQRALEADLPSDLGLEPSEQQLVPSQQWALPSDQMHRPLGHLPPPQLHYQLQLWPPQPLHQLLYHLQQQLLLVGWQLGGGLLAAGQPPLCVELVQLPHSQALLTLGQQQQHTLVQQNQLADCWCHCPMEWLQSSCETSE